MDITFRSDRLRTVCNDTKRLAKEYGPARGRKIQLRLDQLRSAATLDIIGTLGNCHELKGNRRGELAMKLDGPWRLLFEPADEPIPTKPDGGLDWRRVTAVRILGVEDYHD